MLSRGPAKPHPPVTAVPTHGCLGAAACTGAILARVRDRPAWAGASTPRFPLARDLTRASVHAGCPNEGVAL
jgi:hypothetical protein